jgi:hypothetical protein
MSSSIAGQEPEKSAAFEIQILEPRLERALYHSPRTNDHYLQLNYHN